MKYIRTKDERIVEVEGLCWVDKIDEKTKELIPYCLFQIYKYPFVLTETDISKQADTIEELCDRYVLHQTDIIFLNENHTKYRFENEPDNWYDITDTEIRVGIYGAIWTDKGLIYRAKMNEKGKLELL